MTSSGLIRTQQSLYGMYRDSLFQMSCGNKDMWIICRLVRKSSTEETFFCINMCHNSFTEHKCTSSLMYLLLAATRWQGSCGVYREWCSKRTALEYIYIWQLKYGPLVLINLLFKKKKSYIVCWLFCVLCWLLMFTHKSLGGCTLN